MDLTKFENITEIPTIREKLDQGLKIIAMSNYSSPLDVITEIVDNSVDEKDLHNPPLLIQITIERNKLTFFDSHSLGMGYKQLSGFLIWGYSVKRDQREKIGRYGAGGKGAIGYLGVGCRLRTKRKNEDVIWELNEPNWRDEDLKIFNLKPLKNYVDSDMGFTQIDIYKVDKRVNKEELKRTLSHVYKPLLEKSLISIKVNKSNVEPFLIPIDGEEPMEKVNEKTKYGHIVGWFGKLAPKTGIRGGIRCYSNGRLTTRDYKRIQEFFGHPDPQYIGSMNYLIGEVHVDFVPILPNKTDFNRGSEQWFLVEKLMHQRLIPIVEQLRRRKEDIEVTKEDLKNLREVEKLVKLAITHYEREAPRGSDVLEDTDIGRKPSVRLGNGSDANLKINDNPIDHTKTPRTPSPPNAVGKLMRRHGFPKFDVRVGDGLSRGKAIEEDGVKIVVIYKAFPEYLARRGDTLYKAEASVMQLAKPLSEDEIVSPDQYIQIVDDLMREVVRLYNTKKSDNQEEIELEEIIS